MAFPDLCPKQNVILDGESAGEDDGPPKDEEGK
jgi:hypothetical protein